MDAGTARAIEAAISEAMTAGLSEEELKEAQELLADRKAYEKVPCPITSSSTGI